MDKFRVVDDLPPELCQYKDEGCEVCHSCLACSLPRCIYDEPKNIKQMKHMRRDREIQRAYCVEGLGIASLAQRFHISRRTIYRILRRNGQ